MKKILLLLPAASYRNQDFLDAAAALGIEVISAADNCYRLAPSWGLAPLLAIPFDQPELAVPKVMQLLPEAPDAVLAVDDAGLELAAILCQMWNLPGNPMAAVLLTRDKLEFRELLKQNQFNCPQFHHLPDGADPAQVATQFTFPVVVKARRLSASRGIIRADNLQQLVQAVERVRHIQAVEDRDAAELGIIVESFIPGMEYALEGMLEQGKLRQLALFDKPDPLDGPFFEETLYVTPSRLPQPIQDDILATVERVCGLAGLVEGPIHAEMRVNNQGVWLLEVAARSIGGLCGRMLRHALGISLEEVILRQALRLPLPEIKSGGAAGVMMIPLPRRGIYLGTENLEVAKQVPGVTDIVITAVPGQIIAPPPEGASYLGFVFSVGATSQQAEMALRQAHGLLVFNIQGDVALTTQVPNRHEGA